MLYSLRLRGREGLYYPPTHTRACQGVPAAARADRRQAGDTPSTYLGLLASTSRRSANATRRRTAWRICP